MTKATSVLSRFDDYDHKLGFLAKSFMQICHTGTTALLFLGGGEKRMLQIRWHGHACFEITNGITIVTDPHDGSSIGIQKPTVLADVVTVSHDHYDHNSVKSVEKSNTKIITDERKRSVGDAIIKGFASYHDECQGEKRGNNIIFKIEIDGMKFCHLGDLGHELDSDLAEQIGDVDILFIPVGGTYTLDAATAWNVIDTIKPRIIVPMHYKFEGLSLPIAPVDEFLEMRDCEEVRVGVEMDIEKEELPEEQEVWVFTL